MRYSDIVRKRKAKLCPRCGRVKAIESFHADRTRADGRCGICKVCKRVELRVYGRKKRKAARRVKREERRLAKLHALQAKQRGAGDVAVGG